MSKEVQCVPGAHKVPLKEAYWCSHCEQYLCYKHRLKLFWVNTVKCPQGHDVSKAG